MPSKFNYGARRKKSINSGTRSLSKCSSVSFSAFSLPCKETLAAVKRLPNNLPLSHPAEVFYYIQVCFIAQCKARAAPR